HELLAPFLQRVSQRLRAVRLASVKSCNPQAQKEGRSGLAKLYSYGNFLFFCKSPGSPELITQPLFESGNQGRVISLTQSRHGELIDEWGTTGFKYQNMLA